MSLCFSYGKDLLFILLYLVSIFKAWNAGRERKERGDKKERDS